MITRRAVPGLTPVAEELGFEERITRLEDETEMLWHAVRGLNTAVDGLTTLGRDTRTGLGISAKLQASHAERLRRLEGAGRGDTPNLADVVAGIGALAERVERLEQTGRNDLRLSEVLRGIEERLTAIELGGECLP